ncbi:MAG: hypothetical protein Q7K55_08480, partial [Candidatus Levybacteria bacterium]|nr:hypothetical protein [Candidatus Levybacteria bacterium]
ATGWNTDATNRDLTSNYADPGRIFGIWTSGSGGSYTLNWNYIIIPEKLFYLLALGIFIPGLLRRKRKRDP